MDKPLAEMTEQEFKSYCNNLFGSIRTIKPIGKMSDKEFDEYCDWALDYVYNMLEKRRQRQIRYFEKQEKIDENKKVRQIKIEIEDQYRNARDEHAFLLRSEGLSLKEVGARLGVGRERARTLANRFSRKLGRAMRRTKFAVTVTNVGQQT